MTRNERKTGIICSSNDLDQFLQPKQSKQLLHLIELMTQSQFKIKIRFGIITNTATCLHKLHCVGGDIES